MMKILLQHVKHQMLMSLSLLSLKNMTQMLVKIPLWSETTDSHCSSIDQKASSLVVG